MRIERTSLQSHDTERDASLSHGLVPPVRDYRASGSLRGLPSKGVHTAGRLMRTVAVGAIVPLCVLVAWELTTHFQVFSRVLIPSPLAVVQEAALLWSNGTLLGDIGASLLQVAVGFAISLAIALPFGVALARSQVVRQLLAPGLEIIRPVPPVAILPMVVLWFGISNAAAWAVVAFGAFFPLLTNTEAGVRGVPLSMIRASQSLGASRAQIWFRVLLPAAVPSVLAGVRVGFGMAFFAMVAAELITSSTGLGFLILNGQNTLDSAAVFVGIAVLGILGFAISRVLLLIERRTVRRWQGL